MELSQASRNRSTNIRQRVRGKARCADTSYFKDWYVEQEYGSDQKQVGWTRTRKYFDIQTNLLISTAHILDIFEDGVALLFHVDLIIAGLTREANMPI